MHKELDEFIDNEYTDVKNKKQHDDSDDDFSDSEDDYDMCQYQNGMKVINPPSSINHQHSSNDSLPVPSIPNKFHPPLPVMPTLLQSPSFGNNNNHIQQQSKNILYNPDQRILFSSNVNQQHSQPMVQLPNGQFMPLQQHQQRF